jgi:tRNA(fMet)-specific endonuclease VapC
MKYLLDTDTFSLTQYGHVKMLAALTKYLSIDIAICSITIQEQIQGWLSRLNQLKDNDKISDWHSQFVERLLPFWSYFGVIPVSNAVLTHYETLKKMRLNVSTNDLKIAAVAIVHQLTLITRNLRDFNRVPGVIAIDWTID